MLYALLLLHVAISLAAIAAGFPFTANLLAARDGRRWANIFLSTTIATSVSGFVLPADRILPSHVVGAISMVVLALALWARSRFQTDGSLRKTYVVSALTAFYLNVFVLVAQMFQKIPALKALAPTQSEPPFAIVQGAVLIAFLFIGSRALEQFHPAPPRRFAASAI